MIISIIRDQTLIHLLMVYLWVVYNKCIRNEFTEGID